MGVIKSHHFWLEVEQIQEAIQNVLVCLEMVIFAAVQKHAYHVGPYSGETKKKLDKKTEWALARLEWNQLVYVNHFIINQSFVLYVEERIIKAFALMAVMMYIFCI